MKTTDIAPAWLVVEAIEVANVGRAERGEGPILSGADMDRLRALGETPVVFEGNTEGAPAGEIWMRVMHLDGTLII